MPPARRAEMRFDPQRVSLSRVLERIYALGYVPQPLSFTPGEPPMGCAERRSGTEASGGRGLRNDAGHDLRRVLVRRRHARASRRIWSSCCDSSACWSRRRSCCMPRSRFSSPPGAACAAGTLGMDVPVALSIARCLPVERVGDAARTRRGVFRLGGHVHVFPAARTLPGNVAAPSLRPAARCARAPAARQRIARRRRRDVERVTPDELRRRRSSARAAGRTHPGGR